MVQMYLLTKQKQYSTDIEHKLIVSKDKMGRNKLEFGITDAHFCV